MDKQYKNINTLVDEILGIFYIFAPTFLLASLAFVFNDEILSSLISFSANLAEYSF